MRYNLLVKVNGEIYKTPKIYKEDELDWLKDYAEKRCGKIEDRQTGKIIHDFCTCPESKQKTMFVRWGTVLANAFRVVANIVKRK